MEMVEKHYYCDVCKNEIDDSAEYNCTMYFKKRRIDICSHCISILSLAESLGLIKPNFALNEYDYRLQYRSNDT